ncbi:putative leucine-rich repeat domain superfamily [Helianthus debilis subsp. tardiflorus]
MQLFLIFKHLPIFLLSTIFHIEMGGYCTFLLFICIIHFLIVNGEHVTRRNASHHQHHHHHQHQHHHGNTNGNTKTWKGRDICRDYKGFVCDTLPGSNQRFLSGVDFTNFNFDGPNLTISDFLTGLPDILFFHAHANNFTGSIRIKNSTNLSELDLSDNNFSGNFPYELVHANKLKILDLRFNRFSGALPPQVFLLKLECLLLNNNHFNQTLPDNLGSTPVHYLSLANNKLVGGIPLSIGQANNTLIEVLFLNNYLTGCLPYQIGLLAKAKVFDVELNDLTGPVPHSFQCLKNMEHLALA